MATSHNTEIVELAHSLTAFQRDLLAALQANSGGDYGLGVKRTVEEWYGEEVNHGRLYPNLDELADHGLIDKQAMDKRTNSYALTEGGEAVLSVLAACYGGPDE